MQWKPFSAVLTAVFAILIGSYLEVKHAVELDAARAETEAAVKLADQAIVVVQAALSYADSVTAAADAAQAQAARQIAAARRPLPQLPDTCAPAVLALAQADSAYENEHQAAQELRAGLDTVSTATAALVPAVERLDAAATALVRTSKPSFWSHLKPEIQIDAVTYFPRTGEIKAGPSISIGWSIGL